MTQLYLIRHAIAFERDRKRWPDDRQRPLTPEGIKKFRKAAAGLEHFIDSVDCLLSSPLVRAKETAEILADVAHWPKPVEVSAFSPGRTPAQALTALREYPSKSIAIVGHEPNLSELLAVCMAGPGANIAVQFKKGGVASLTFSAAPRAGQAKLNWLAIPKMLRAL